jgi:predicted nucleic acid-binding protein
MKNKAIDARKHAFTNADAILFDANILLYLYGPAADPLSWKVQTYSSVFSRALSGGSKLFLDVLVASEFINRFARIEMARLQPGESDFKAFRKSTDFISVSKAIETQITQILAVCKPLDHFYSEWNHIDLLSQFALGNFDYNDQLIAENCRKHRLVLLTNDHDFTEGGITVLTANHKLLGACG